MTPAKTIELLKERVEELETLLELNETVPNLYELPVRYTKGKYAKSTTAIVNMLLKRNFVNHDVMALALGCEGKSVDVFMVGARKFLKAHGITIRTIWGEGWSITGADKMRLREILRREECSAEYNATSRGESELKAALPAPVAHVEEVAPVEPPKKVRVKPPITWPDRIPPRHARKARVRWANQILQCLVERVPRQRRA